MAVSAKANNSIFNLLEAEDLPITMVNIARLRIVAQPGEQYIDFVFDDTSSVRWSLSSANGFTLLSKPAGGSWKTEKRINWTS